MLSRLVYCSSRRWQDVVMKDTTTGLHCNYSKDTM